MKVLEVLPYSSAGGEGSPGEGGEEGTAAQPIRIQRPAQSSK